jgi:ABC-type sugar transport system ATPase subunit
VTEVASEAIMARLPVGDRMIVKIAATFLEDAAAPARLFVMDEPTAALNAEESERLFRVIGQLQRKGCGVLYVSHRIDEVLRISNRITVLRDGATRATLGASEASRASLIELMTGREDSATPLQRRVQADSAIALSVENLSGDDLRDISFDLRQGEILGLTGLANAGQDRLLKALMGRARSGRVALAGQPLRARGFAQSWRRGIAYAPRERRSEGLLLSENVIGNVVLPHLSRLSHFATFLDRRAERAKAGEVARRVRLKSAGLGQRVWRLSGGNQQKVMLARAITGSPKILLLDEPTRGVDIGAKFDIHALLRELAAAGAGIVLSSTDHEELLGLADRVAILRDGAIATIVPAAGLTPQRLAILCQGGAPE